MQEITRISSKGQVVIPKGMREELDLKDGNLIIINSQNNTLLLKKIEIPKIKSWEEATRPFREATEKSKFTEENLQKIILESKRR